VKQKEFNVWMAEVELADLKHLQKLRQKFHYLATAKDGSFGARLYAKIKGKIWKLDMMEMHAVIHNAPLREETLLMRRQDFEDIVKWGKGISMGAKVGHTSIPSPSTKKDSEPGSTK
jgi:hypothetical protein